MEPDSPKYLRHVLTAGERIAAYTRNITFDQYTTGSMRMDAVERQFITVGEAIRRLVDHDEETASQIRDYRDAVNFRNVLVHQYHRVEQPKVWEAVQITLPRMLREVESLLEAEDTPQRNPAGAAP